MTLPDRNQDTVCLDTTGTLLQDLATLRIFGWRTTDPDTIPFGTVTVHGKEGDLIGILFDVEDGSVGELLVEAGDIYGYYSCPAHYVFAVPMDTTTAPQPSPSDLTAAYYDNADFTALFDALPDSIINESWGGAPLPGMGADQFSVRWTGQVRAPMSGNFTICPEVCNGDFKFYLTGSLLSQRDVGTSCGELCKTVGLTAGNRYDAVLEYRHQTGQAAASIRWLTPTGGDQIIPASAWR